ncbi:MAG: EthD family reductase [Terriglobales bacterium]
MTVLRVCYKSGIRFDESYYTSKHLPLAGGIMGPHGLKSVEMVKVTATGNGAPSPYQVIFTAYFESAQALQQAMQDPRMPEILADVAKFYDGMPDLLIGDVVISAPVTT